MSSFNRSGHAQDGEVPAHANVRLAHVFREHTAPVQSIRFSPGGDHLASAATGDGIWLWDVSRYVRIGTIGASAEVEITELAFSHDGMLLAGARADGLVSLWTPDGQHHGDLPGHAQGATGALFTPDDHIVLTSDGAGTVRLWELAGRRLLASFPGDTAGGPTYVGNVTALPQAQPGMLRLALVSGDTRGEVQIWDLGLNGLDIAWVGAVIPPGHIAMSPRFSPDGEVLAICEMDTARPPVGSTRLFDAHTFEPQGTLQQAGEVAIECCFSPDSRYLAVAGGAGTAAIWDLPLREVVISFPAHVGGFDYRWGAEEWAIGAIDWSPRNRMIATSGMSTFDLDLLEPDGGGYPIKLWEIELGT